MGDFKSKLPDLKELGSMTNKLFHGIKSSVNEIVQDYKQKREEQEAQEKAAEALKAKEAPVVKETLVTQPETKVVVEEPPPITPVPPVVEPVEPPEAPQDKVPGPGEQK